MLLYSRRKKEKEEGGRKGRWSLSLTEVSFFEPNRISSWGFLGPALQG